MTQLILLIDVAAELAIVGDPPNGFVGRTYTHTFTAVEGTAPYAWSIIDSVLPAGWTLNATTGVLSRATPIASADPILFTVHCRDALLIESTLPCEIKVGYPLETLLEEI